MAYLGSLGMAEFFLHLTFEQFTIWSVD